MDGSRLTVTHGGAAPDGPAAPGPPGAGLRRLVDPFVGTEPADLPPPSPLAASWWWPKPAIGNTHPGACHPLGMVSVAPYSGAYPTGYGRWDRCTEGLPAPLHDRPVASGFTHFQQSGTGAIRKYYNYVRVTPMVVPLDDLGTTWDLEDEAAGPGWYRARLASGIEAEVTAGPKSAVHRYTFPACDSSRIVVDLSLGGLAIEHGRTVPSAVSMQVLGHGRARAELVVEGVPLAVHLELDLPGAGEVDGGPLEWRQMLWHDRRLMPGGSRLDLEAIRETTLRSFGFVFLGPTTAGQSVELELGFSLRGPAQAEANLRADLGARPRSLARRRVATEGAWDEHLDRIRVEGGTQEQRGVFATALYHSLLKPCVAPDESPFWDRAGPFVFDVATMWDIYKTQLPLLLAIAPDTASEVLQALLRVAEEEGNLPIGYRMARGADRFFRQASALVHTALADAAAAGVRGIDWELALLLMHNDLRRTYGEDFLERGVAHPVTHTLDLAFGYHCTAQVARRIGDDVLADRLDDLAAGWVRAFDADTGLLVDSTFYEGGRWNYSFRLLHDMAARVRLAGGEARFVGLLDRFFGFDAVAAGEAPPPRPGRDPGAAELAAGYALDRFEGLNNEPDMEAPWAYHWAGRPDRTAEVVHAVVHHVFGPGRGGLPGNDDSGGLSSWYVWASTGLFPVAGQGLFLVGPPAFPGVEVDVRGGTFRIETHGFAPVGPGTPPQHVQRAWLDGVPLDRTHLHLAEVHDGATLRLDLGPEPGDWGRASRPPSRPRTTAGP